MYTCEKKTCRQGRENCVLCVHALDNGDRRIG